MIHNISSQIASILVRHGEATEENADIYTYAIEAVIAALFNIAICLTIAILFGRVVEGIVFMSAFVLLRRFTGGYHANTHFKCILIFSILFTCAMIMTSFAPIFNPSILIPSIIAAISWFGIAIFAPINDKNKSHSNVFKKRIKKKSILASTLLFTLCIIAGLFFNNHIAFALSLAMLSVFAGLLYLHTMGKQR